jgi:phosphoribosylformimino-5-aminoimidazole carboxamide ribotide isomerase
MIIIPAIDIYQNKITRLYQGNYQKSTFYDIDPTDFAIKLEQMGFTHLHLVDLEGARTGKTSIFNLIKDIRSKTSLHLDVGGGIRSTEVALQILETGADAVNVGSAIINNTNFFEELNKFISSDKIIFSADVVNHRLKVSGWEKNSEKKIHDILKELIPMGLKYVSCTDISKDGTLQGVNAKMYGEYVHLFPELRWIAGGGVSSAADVVKLKEAGCYACIVGRAVYENEGFLNELLTLC